MGPGTVSWRRSAVDVWRLHGPLSVPIFLVTDNGPSFIVRHLRNTPEGSRIAATGFSSFSQVRIGYRLSTQLGLLKRFHETLKYEGVQ